MPDKYTIVCGCSYKILFRNEGEQVDLTRLTSYMDSKKEEEGFPNIIFADSLPDSQDLTRMIENENGFKRINPIVLAVKDKVGRHKPDYWHLLELGFDDVIEWEEEAEMITYIQSKFERNQTISTILNSPLVTGNLVGGSIVWKRFLAGVIEASLFSQASVLLVGESGTGKEMISRLIHTIDPRPDKKKLIIVDCTTIVPELSGSELFGHERGSYTNAIQSREGAVALANGGTLFLDEIGELPLNLQAELLRVLQEGTYKKVGSNTWQKTNFRLVCATNKNLQKEVEEGRFRQDLYFRIADCEYLVPALHQRKDDIPDLVRTFLSQIFAGKKCPEPDKPVMDYLVNRDYPGNVRQLRQLVQRIALKHVHHKKITIGEVPESDRYMYSAVKDAASIRDLETIIRKALLTGEDLWKLKDRLSETAIQVALDIEHNNKQKAAELLGVDVRTVQQHVKRRGV
ncbi:MAG: sigma 54-interacting transcriptional regulator [Ferruginibacter sp.]